jgi:RimJ/RimL family protein N-acetyltransferase
MKPDAATRLARIRALKCDTHEQALARALPIEADGAVIGSLVPIGPWILSDAHHIDLICQWRQAAMKMFMAQFESTPERTRHYLEQRSVGEPDRILFFIHDADERCVGHGGFSGIGEDTAELDNLMRGVGGGHPALIQHAERTLLAWLFDQMGSSEITARVLSYNWLVIELHERLGFRRRTSLPLRKTTHEGGLTLLEPCDSDQANVRHTCLELVLDRSSFEAALDTPTATDRPQALPSNARST